MYIHLFTSSSAYINLPLPQIVCAWSPTYKQVYIYTLGRGLLQIASNLLKLQGTNNCLFILIVHG